MSVKTRYRAMTFAAIMVAGSAASVAAQIPASEYAARRDSLAARIRDGVLIAFGGRTPVTDFGTFFQLPTFHYLTGFDEPDAAMLLVADRGRARTFLFVTAADARRAFYYGWRPDSAAVTRTLRVIGRPSTELARVVDSLAQAERPVYTIADVEDVDFARQDTLTRGQQFIRALVARHPGLVVKDGQPIVNELRARKSPAEIALLKRAAEISSEGHRAAMEMGRGARHEYELQAALEGTFKRLGSERPAYGSIVGAGINGTQLHYMKDTAAALPGELVVIDAAAEYHGYAADITRTLPVAGTYTPAQREIYQLVRAAQAIAEKYSGPGLSEQAAQDSSVELRARGLARLGLIESVDATFDPPWQADCRRQPRACREAMFWMIHGISHGLGLAVHDPAQFNFGDHTYRPGDAFTIEPGIYISTRMLSALPDTPKNRVFIAKVRPAVEHYENTGVRIEDDYVITPTGLERLSTAPREIAEVEALMKRGSRVVP